VNGSNRRRRPFPARQARPSRWACRGGRAGVIAALLAAASASPAQQVADTAFRPPIASPAYTQGAGPLVLLDEAHHNFHTVEGRYAPFVDLVRRDGYRVEPLRAPFSAASLAPAAVLVIANALGASNTESWARPIAPAFTPAEVRAVRAWVEGGGSLLLIADHMPFAGAAAELGSAFGLEFSDGFAMPASGQGGAIVFARRDSSLATHAIVEGRTPRERIDSVVTFTGQGFKAPSADASPLLRLPSDIQVLEPDTAWVFSAATRRHTGAGWLQGAALEVGRGRVVVLGEAAMFSAQLGGAQRVPVGMNSAAAAQNPQLLLNTMHWLTRVLEP
jgi:hypothetical protein